jgi:hypothetical protein
MKAILLCNRQGSCCVKAKPLDNGGLELKDKKDGRNIILSKDERDELRNLMVHGVI